MVWLKRFFSRKKLLSPQEVLHELKKITPEQWLPQAACLMNSLPMSCSLGQSGLSKEMIEFINEYEPKAAKYGIYRHQQRILAATLTACRYFLLTSATGSGKSLCFWAWVVHELVKQPQGTMIVCLPTQALLWGQAARLEELSTDCCYSQAGPALAGRLTIADVSIDWTVWKGRKNDQEMASHEESRRFRRARLRLATVDKVHYSLLRERSDFFYRLIGMVLDEAHQYQGVFGAQVAYLVKRLAVVKQACHQLPLKFFLASATLPHPVDFAAKLLSVSSQAIFHEPDPVASSVTLTDWRAAEALLFHPPAHSLSRIVVFTNRSRAVAPFWTLLKQPVLQRCRLIYFSGGKCASRLLKRRLDAAQKGQKIVVYDADLATDRRRGLERQFRSSDQAPVTLIATNALELGVDIEKMDVCLLPRLPTDSAQLLQRIGRVGRRAERPGLVLAALPAEGTDGCLRALFQPSRRPFHLPLEIAAIRLKSRVALQHEVDQGVKRLEIDHADYQQAVRQKYGECLPLAAIEKNLAAIGFQGAQNDSLWSYHGFRGAAQTAKLPLIPVGGTEAVALLDQPTVLREAHPGAIYGDDGGNYWKVRVDSAWPRGDGGLIDLNRILFLPVIPVSGRFVTRGIVQQSVALREPLLRSIVKPGDFVYGRWLCRQRVKSYRKRWVQGRRLSIETIPGGNGFCRRFVSLGWRWNFLRRLTPQENLCLREMTDFFQQIFAPLLADEVGAEAQDLLIDYSGRDATLTVIDAAEPGSGVAFAAWQDKNVLPKVFDECCRLLASNRQILSKQSASVRRALQSISDLSLAVRLVTTLSQDWQQLSS